MKTAWLIEKDLHEIEFYQRMHVALDKCNIPWLDQSYTPADNNLAKDYLTLLLSIPSEDRERTLFVPYGSVDYIKGCHACELMTYKTRHPPFWTFFDLHKLSFEQYTVNGAKYMLNQSFVIITYAELKRRRDWFFDKIGKDIGKGKAIFVRPVSNDKVFTGRLFYEDSFEREIVYMGYSKPPVMDPALLVVVAPPVPLNKEYRFAVVDKKIVASTCYQQWENGLPDNEEIQGCDSVRVTEYAQRIASDPDFSPDDAYILDVADTPDGPGMIEIGSINSAGWYAMDCEAVIMAIAKLAEKY